MSKVILIDTSGLFVPTVKVVNRLRMQRAKNNTNNFILPPRAMYFNSLISCLKKIGVNKDDIVIMTLEGKSWRKNYAGYYKNQRQGLRDADSFVDWSYEFKQLNKLHEELDNSTNWHFVREWHSEADDIVAVACRFYKDKEVIVVTGDKDLHQLAYYSNVKFFNINKKCNGSKGMYEKINNPLKIIADKVRLGDVGDNIIVNKLTDCPQDEQLRYFIIDLLHLPEEIEDAVTNILANIKIKELNLANLPNFKNVEQKFLQIYKKDKIITYDYCVSLLNKRLDKKNKKNKEKRDAKKLSELQEMFKNRPLSSLTKKEFNKLKKTGMLWEFYPEAPESYETIEIK